MARWENPDHAYAYQVLLGRLAGLYENQIRKLIASRRTEQIFTAAVVDKALEP